jgi:hypothetical protein
MAVSHALAALGRFIRRTPPPPTDLLEAYAHEVIPVLDRAEWLYQYWLEQSTLFTDGEKLGNVAAIHRWETATMGRSLERVIPPAVLADAHERVVRALEMASRAAQLLSNGSRFHNANAVCEGQALLSASRERRLDALRSMRRHLAHFQPAISSTADSASSEVPAADAALATSVGAAPPSDLPPVGPAADGATVGPAPDVPTVRDDQPVDGGDANPQTPWPDLAGTDLILTDPDEPEPAWLSAARHDAPAADAPSERPPAPTVRPSPDPARAEVTAPPPLVAQDENLDRAGVVDPSTPDERPPSGPSAAASPPETAAPAPRTQPEGHAAEAPSPSGWGTLFGKRLDHSDR